MKPKPPIAEITLRKTSAASVTCYSCNATGHFAKNCSWRSNKEDKTIGEVGPLQEKRLNVCVVNMSEGMLRHASEQFKFTYNSGTEHSLIRESIACTHLLLHLNTFINWRDRKANLSTSQVLRSCTCDHVFKAQALLVN